MSTASLPALREALTALAEGVGKHAERSRGLASVHERAETQAARLAQVCDSAQRDAVHWYELTAHGFRFTRRRSISRSRCANCARKVMPRGSSRRRRFRSPAASSISRGSSVSTIRTRFRSTALSNTRARRLRICRKGCPIRRCRITSIACWMPCCRCWPLRADAHSFYSLRTARCVALPKSFHSASIFRCSFRARLRGTGC